MAKKPGRRPKSETKGAGQLERGAKTKAVKAYLSEHRKAMPKEVVAALAQQGITISPNMVSIIKAKSKVGRAKHKASQAAAAGMPSPGGNAAGLDAALTLY